MKRFIYSTITIVIILFGYYLYDFFSGFHKTDWDLDKEYLWLFKDSVSNNINSELSYSIRGNSDVCNTFHYGKYKITMWEFKDLKTYNQFDLKIVDEISDGKLGFESGEVLNKRGNLPITVRKYFTLDDKYRIKLEKGTIIHQKIKGKNYSGFCVSLSKFSLNDIAWRDQIIFDYLDQIKKVYIIIYYANNSSYFILIDSKKDLELDSYKMLNLPLD